jgi:hypothetical protein
MIKSQKRFNKQRKLMNNRYQLTRQLFETDIYLVDYAFAPTDNASTGYDLYSVISLSTDYSNNALSYGEMSWLAVEFRYMPFLRYSALNTDYAIGAFGTRQGVFDVTVAAKTYQNVIREPGSLLITNKDPFDLKTPITQKRFVSTTDTNTIVSEVPKVNFYFAWSNVASTSTVLGLLHVRLLVKYRAKSD